MLKIIFGFCLLSIFVYACNNGATNSVKVDTLPAVAQDDFPIRSTMSYSEEMFNNDTIDTENYTGFPYRDSTMDCYESYIDTFTEGGARFRIVSEHSDTSISTATVEKFADGKWIKRILFERLNHTGDFAHAEDVNRDGYVDFTRGLRFTSEAYLFDPSIKDFVAPSGVDLNYEIYVIDSNRNIFCDFQDFKQMAGQLHSKLYTFKGFARYDLYDLEFYNGGEDSSSLVTKLILSKCISGDADSTQTIEEIKLPQTIDIEEVSKKYADSSDYFYDYRSFWKERYKKLVQ